MSPDDSDTVARVRSRKNILRLRETVSVLEEIDAVFDFKKTVMEGKTFITDASAVNAAFRKARVLLADMKDDRDFVSVFEVPPKAKEGSESDFAEKRQRYLGSHRFLVGFYGWWFLQNTVIRPLLGVLPVKTLFRFSDVVEEKTKG